MKRVGLIFLVGALLVLFNMSRPAAFHSGGVAECNGCHSMHNPAPNGSALLVGTDASSTCLTCHMSPGDTAPRSYHIATPTADMPAGTPPIQRSPGGDFGWLAKTYSWVPRTGAATEYSYGQAHGHNIVAVDTTEFALPDPDNTLAPGGTFPSSQLGCQSCHDPHGRVRRRSDGSYATAATLGGTAEPIIGSGSTGAIPAAGLAVGTYRLLRGLGDATQSATFAGVAVAVAPSTYNQSEAVNQVRVAYGHDAGNTWGNWCGSCHPDMHSAGGNYVHPVDEALSQGNVNNIYNAYVASGNLSGTAATSFLSLVPFAENTGAIATLASHASNSGAYLNGPASSDRVTCLSCHRAHASGFDHMLRWNMGNEFMVFNGSYIGSAGVAQGRTVGEMTAAYYDRPATQFATYQRVLCNKCHAQD